MSTNSTTSTTNLGNGAGINFTGMASGLDWNSLVTQMMAVEAQPQTLLKQQQTVENARTSALRDISSRLLTLKSAADDLRSFTLYNGSPYAGSSDSTLVTASPTANAAPGTYNLVVNQLAAANILQQHADSFSTTLGYRYAGDGVYAGPQTLLTSLTDASGNSLGYTAGSTITLNATQNGSAVAPATFTVTDTTTLDDLRSFVQTSLAGSTVTLGPGGAMTITSAPGDEQAYTNIALTGTPAAGGGPVTDLGGGNPPAPTGSLGSVRVHGTGTVDIASSGLSIRINVNDGDTMDTVAAAINGKNGNVTASVVNGELRLAAKQTGAASAITMTPSSGVSLGSFDTLVAAQNASGTINGTTQIDSATNTLASALQGVTINLLGTTTSAGVNLTVNPSRVDNQAIKDKVNAFVSAYNDVITTVSAKINEQPVANPQTDDDRIKGCLFGDSTLTTLVSSLRNAMMSPVGGLSSGQNLGASVGISTGPTSSTINADSVAGKLQLDESKLDAALAGGTDAVKSLFMSNGGTSALDGLMQRVSDIAWNATMTGGTVTAAIDGSTATVNDLAQRIADMQTQLDQRQQTLKDQFVAMETALSQLQSMGNQMSGAMGGLPSSSSSSS